MKYFIGCDLGGTNIKVGIVDVTKGEVIASKGVRTLARNGHEDVMRRMAQIMQTLVSENQVPWDDIGGIGVSAPGVLDLQKGDTLFLPNLHGQWRNVPLKARLEAYLGKPVYILNDVRAITFGEWAFGAGKGVDTMVCFAIGTGVGGGVIVNNQLVLTQGGTAGELGHISVDVNGPKCGCGNYGCVEVYASGPAITAMGVKAVLQGLTTSIGDRCGHDLNKISPKLLATVALDGDEVAQSIWDTAGYHLGVGICNAALVVGPKRVVISGGVSAAGDLLLNPVRRALKERMFVMPSDQIEIVLGKLGDDAGIIGTAVWAARGGRPIA
jgi:glucokinase